MLEELKDIHLPEPISWWPPAAGWWLLAFAALLLLVFAVRYLRRPTLKKMALSILDRIEKEYKETNDCAKCLKELSVLLRRVAITKEARCAGLTGAAWLEHLDRGMKEPEFSQGAGELLLSGPYQGHVESDQVPKLMQLCRKWMVAK